MLQVLDQYRKLYTKETSKSCFTFPDENRYSTIPTWEYVCWLERLLSGSKDTTLLEKLSGVYNPVIETTGGGETVWKI